MKDVLYTIASTRTVRAFQVAMCLLWLALMVETAIMHYDPGTSVFGDRGRDIGLFIFVLAVWILSTIMTFVNRTVFDEEGIEQRKFLRGTKRFDYLEIRNLKIRSGWLSAVSLHTFDNRQMLILGNLRQLARAEEILRERVPAVR